MLNLGIKNQQIVTYRPNGHGVDWEDPRIAMLRFCVDEIKDRNVQGNIAEVGVYRGEFASYLNRYLLGRKLYLFDTFSGFSDRDKSENDMQYESNQTFRDTSEQIVLRRQDEINSHSVKENDRPIANL